MSGNNKSKAEREEALKEFKAIRNKIPHECQQVYRNYALCVLSHWKYLKNSNPKLSRQDLKDLIKKENSYPEFCKIEFNFKECIAKHENNLNKL